MGRLHAMAAAALLALAGSAGAQDAATPPREVAPGANQDGVVHVNAMKNPEMHSYRAIVAGLDKFDELHALAPAVPRLMFAARARNGGPLKGEMPGAKLTADDFALDLPLDAAAEFVVPRSQQAWDSKAELVLSRKRKEVRVWPSVRTPGLREDQRRLGDIRLECQVLVAVAKKEAPFYIVALANTVFLTGDWCSFFMKDRERTWDVRMPSALVSATLRDGTRSVELEVDGNRFMVPIGDASWSNDALVDVVFATPAAAALPTRTAAETPRTAP